MSWQFFAANSYPSTPTPEQIFQDKDATKSTANIIVRDGVGVLKRSTGGGQTWEEVAAPRHSYNGLLPSPNLAVDRTVYLLSEEALFRSTDLGDTWKRWSPEGSAGSLVAKAISPTLDDGSYRLFLGTSEGEFLSIDPDKLAWKPY